MTDDLASDEFDDSVAALNGAIADMDAGDSGVSFDQFVAELRQRRNLPARP